MLKRATESELKSQSMHLSVLFESADFCAVFWFPYPCKIIGNQFDSWTEMQIQMKKCIGKHVCTFQLFKTILIIQTQAPF